MNDTDPESTWHSPLDSVQPLIDGWTENLCQLFEMMAGQRPQVSWKAIGRSAGTAEVASDADVLWWEQRFQFSNEAAVWVGSPRETWDYAATLLLKAAGLETVPDGEALKTWQEILSQWFSALARSIGSMLGQEVTCLAGADKAPPPGQQDWVRVSLGFDDRALPPLTATFSAPLLQLLNKQPAAIAESAEDSPAPEAEAPAGTSRTMELLLDVELPVSISFGRTELPLKDVLKLTTGSIVELNRSLNEPVDILVNHCLIARGEVVVIDGNYGVRIQRIVNRQNRLRTLH